MLAGRWAGISAADLTQLYGVGGRSKRQYLYVLDPDGKVLKTIDGATLGDAKRPHMLWGVPKDEYIYSANTVSNSITVLGHKDGGVKVIIANVGKSPHAAQPNPQHPDRIYVSNIAPQAAGYGKPDRGETITELVRTGGPNGRLRASSI